MKLFIFIFIYLIIKFGNCKGVEYKEDFNGVYLNYTKAKILYNLEPNYLKWADSTNGQTKFISFMSPYEELSVSPYLNGFYGNPFFGTDLSFQRLINPTIDCQDNYFNLVGIMKYDVENQTIEPSVDPNYHSLDVSMSTPSPTPTPTPTPKPITIDSFPNITLLTIANHKFLSSRSGSKEISVTYRKSTINMNPIDAKNFPKSFDHQNNNLYLLARERSSSSNGNEKVFIIVYNTISNTIIQKEIISDLIFESIGISGYNNSLFVVGSKQDSNLTYLYQINYNDKDNLKMDLIQTIPLINYQQLVCENSRFLYLYSNVNKVIVKIDLFYKNETKCITIIPTDIPIMQMKNSRIMAIAYYDHDEFHKQFLGEETLLSTPAPTEDHGYYYHGFENNDNYYEEHKEKLSNDAKIALAITIPFAGFLIALGITIFIIIRCKRIKRKNKQNSPEIKTNNPNEEFENVGADGVKE
ncbi:hypothetical protein ACTA71_004737 [Dictyostelium dimigraforme]